MTEQIASERERDRGTGGNVSLETLRKEYDTVTAVEAVDLTIEPGEFLTLLGPSGCGKSTTLRMISGLETPTDGDVFISGERVTDLPANKRNTGMVFQEWALFPHMTVEQNVSFGLEMNGVPKAEREQRVTETLELVELPDYHDRKVTELSGGQKQRVAMARAIVREPDVLLLDEPLASLDRKLRQHMQIELKRIQQELGITFVYVTHDQEEALTMSDRIAVMQDGQIEQVGTATGLYEQPETTFVATFIGETNLFEGEFDAGSGTVVTDTLELAVEEQSADTSEQIAVSVRPEELQIATPDAKMDYENTWTGTVSEAIYKGSIKYYRVEVGDVELEVEQQVNDGTTSFAEGERVAVGFSARACTVVTD